MRKILGFMFDEFGLHQAPSVPHSPAISINVLIADSVLKYPVPKGSKKYTGHTPNQTKHRAMKEMVGIILDQELSENPDCLILALGKSIEEVLEYCAEQGRLDLGPVLCGFPHPSGANGHRKKPFAERNLRLQKQIEEGF